MLKVQRRYGGLMIARATVALNAAVPKSEQSARDITQFEIAVIDSPPVAPTGNTAADWDTAMALVEIPANAVILHWQRV